MSYTFCPACQNRISDILSHADECPNADFLPESERKRIRLTDAFGAAIIGDITWDEYQRIRREIMEK